VFLEVKKNIMIIIDIKNTAVKATICSNSISN
jgi:hypothetical protein